MLMRYSVYSMYSALSIVDIDEGNGCRWISEKLTIHVFIYSPFGVQVCQFLELDPHQVVSLTDSRLSVCLCAAKSDFEFQRNLLGSVISNYVHSHER